MEFGSFQKRAAVCDSMALSTVRGVCTNARQAVVVQTGIHPVSPSEALLPGTPYWQQYVTSHSKSLIGDVEIDCLSACVGFPLCRRMFHGGILFCVITLFSIGLQLRKQTVGARTSAVASTLHCFFALLEHVPRGGVGRVVGPDFSGPGRLCVLVWHLDVAL